MIVSWFYFAIKIGCIAYLLYRLWVVLFRYQLFGFWDMVLPQKTPPIRKSKASSIDIDEDVLGRTTVVYLDDPDLAATVPEHSEELPPSDFLGEEKDITPEEVEDTLSTEHPYVPSEEELYEDEERQPLDTEFSRGLTFEEITNVVNVLSTTNGNDEQMIEAARTIFDVQHTDLFQFFTTQVSNADAVEKLLTECLDNDGKPLLGQRSSKTHKEIMIFDWERYV
ncbi:DUF4122 family protein [Alistipes finegoldii]|uniref:DUF4122 family protein n=1 Tax=Alistipes finegoldii TaxID=214856 RepID=UPI0018996BC0|nr:DUF4122 family protein [Alistipes finegoldii]